MKNQKGITLVALIITIIVMLILAGVSISLVVGENGVLTQAQDAGERTKNAEAEQAVSLAFADLMMQYYATTDNTERTAIYSAANVEDAIKDNGAKEADVTETTVSSSTTTIKVDGIDITVQIEGDAANAPLKLKSATAPVTSNTSR